MTPLIWLFVFTNQSVIPRNVQISLGFPNRAMSALLGRQHAGESLRGLTVGRSRETVTVQAHSDLE